MKFQQESIPYRWYKNYEKIIYVTNKLQLTIKISILYNYYHELL